MKDIIKLNSRDGTDNRLVKIEEGKYKLITPYCYRSGLVDDNKAFIDPSGGPMLVEGNYVHEATAIIESIEKGIIKFKNDILSYETTGTI
jgi:hypothetical protein